MTAITPEPIMRVANGFMASQYLFVANEIGLFEQLADHSATIEELATATGIADRRLRVLAEALVSLGFLEKEQHFYRNSAVARTFLCGRTSHDFRSALRFFRLRYPLWAQFEAVLRTGQAAEMQLSEEEHTIFSAGIEAGTVRTAQALTDAYDFGQHRSLLDLGGGTGSFLIAILARYSHLRTTLFDTPEVCQVASQRLTQTPFAQQITIVPGNVFTASLPSDHDAIMLNNVLHLFSPEHNFQLLQHIRGQVNPGTRLLLIDSWTDTDQLQPSPIALVVGDFLLQTGEGNVYSEHEIRQWLEEAGWHFLARNPLGGPASLVAAEA